MNYIQTRAKERGIPMIDSRRNIVVEVSSKDCKAAEGNPKDCALARAVKREYKGKGVLAAYFLRTSAWLEYEDKLVRFDLPISVQKEIVSFDRGAGFAPGKYSLSKVPPSSKLGTRPRPPGKRSNGRGRRTVIHRTEGVRNVVDIDA
jgi:hypothetical protein